MTSLACIIGWPVEQSLSPAIHNAAFAARDLDWTYVALAVRDGAVDEGVTLLRTLDAAGVNVTVPHKQAIVPHCARLEGDAEAFGAVNTLVRDGADFIGHNTDGAGFVRFLRADASFEPVGARALVVGAGGAARAVAVALAREGADVVVCARQSAAAEAIAGLFPGVTAGDWGDFPAADLVVQATSVRSGLPVERMPLAPGVV
ncbi:MAG TPA: shikimate dehydrogenase, partial [Actinomycetota bacterium]|nr:shikimate dehydrogenase [Actinomycetota bacterium]